jgi:hypothetical protein
LIERWADKADGSSHGAGAVAAGVAVGASAVGSSFSGVGSAEEEEWWLRSGVGQGASWALASSADAERSDHALWPAVTVAARVWRFVRGGRSKGGEDAGDGGVVAAEAAASALAALNGEGDLGSTLLSGGGSYDRHVAVSGYAFAALKLASLPTGWPLHVSARWALSDNRRDLVRCSLNSCVTCL